MPQARHSPLHSPALPSNGLRERQHMACTSYRAKALEPKPKGGAGRPGTCAGRLGPSWAFTSPSDELSLVLGLALSCSLGLLRYCMYAMCCAFGCMLYAPRRDDGGALTGAVAKCDCDCDCARTQVSLLSEEGGVVHPLGATPPRWTPAQRNAGPRISIVWCQYLEIRCDGKVQTREARGADVAVPMSSILAQALP